MLDLVSELIDYDFTAGNDFRETAFNLASNAAQKTNSAVDSTASKNLLEEYARIYGRVKAHKALIKAVYRVKIENIFGHKGDIPWFKDQTLSYLATNAELSLGSNESESYQAGSYQANYLTQQTSSEMDITFIETAKGDISKSYKACRRLAFNNDGTMNETKSYAFKLTVALLNPNDPRRVAVQESWIVGVKSASIELSASSRSELVEIPVTFEKLRPLSFSS